MLTFVGIFLFVLAIACVMGWLWGSYRPVKSAGSRPADDAAGGFASPAQLQQSLSIAAIERAGAQVRPGLPQQQTASIKGKKRGALTRGRG